MFLVFKKSVLFFTLTIFILLPSFANAGVLVRSVRGGVRGYTVKTSTAATRATNPNLEYRGQTLMSQVNYFDRIERNYEKELAKWYRNKEKYEQRLAAEKKKQQEQDRKYALKYSRSFENTNGNTTLASNPLSWFKKRIGKIDNKEEVKIPNRPKIEFNKTSRGKLSDDDSALNLDNPGTKKKESFWKRILTALGIA